MLLDLIIGISVMALCLLLQAVLLLAASRYYGRHHTVIREYSFFSALGVLGGVMLILLLGNIAQIGVWALVFRLLGEFGDFPLAFYHSAVNFATLGYGDLVMSESNRLLGPLEAINGVLMIGVSTAALMTAFLDALNKAQRAGQKAD